MENTIKLYDFNLLFEENFLHDDEDKHIVIRISAKDNKIDLMFDKSSVCLSSPKKLLQVSKLHFLIWDYDSIFGTRYNIFKLYNKDFFDCQERVFFESLIIKFKRNKFTPFRWEKTKIGMELGIKRNKRDSIIKRFKELGIIKTATLKSIKNKNGFENSYFFNLDCQRIYDLLPTIFSEFDYKKVENNIFNYLSPKLKSKID